MHELSLVEALVDECRRLAGDRPVVALRVRVGATLGGDELHQAFALLTADTLLAGAVLEVEAEAPAITCDCGFRGPVGADDVIGHVVVCPGCGAGARVRGRRARTPVPVVRRMTASGSSPPAARPVRA